MGVGETSKRFETIDWFLRERGFQVYDFYTLKHLDCTKAYIKQTKKKKRYYFESFKYNQFAHTFFTSV